jgi:hypothetical protein
MKKSSLALILSALVAASAAGCRRPAPEVPPETPAPAPAQPAPGNTAKPVAGEGRPETNNDPGDFRDDGNSRTSRSVEPADEQPAKTPEKTKE